MILVLIIGKMNIFKIIFNFTSFQKWINVVSYYDIISFVHTKTIEKYFEREKHDVKRL